MGFWRVPGKPRDVARWLRKHPPASAQGVGSGGPHPWFLQFPFPDQPGVNDHFLTITLAAAKGGGTAVRADGTAIWLPRRGRGPGHQGQPHER